MNISNAKSYIVKNARPIELAVYRFFYEGGSRQQVISELKKYQNADGGFAHGLEADNWNPNSNPITVNDALIILYKAGALKDNDKMINGMIRYLKSHDSFDEVKKCWMFAIESNKDYPHAIWWEKDGDGVSNYNPTVSLAAFLICMDGRNAYYEEIIKEAFHYLENEKVSGADDLKSYMLCYELLKNYEINDIIPLDSCKELLSKKIEEAICKDTQKYGIEYVSLPSDFFAGFYLEFITPEIQEWIDTEKTILAGLQCEDGGFEISWQWYNDYKEFAQSREWWRPRLTLEKLMFYEADHKNNRGNDN